MQETADGLNPSQDDIFPIVQGFDITDLISSLDEKLELGQNAVNKESTGMEMIPAETALAYDASETMNQEIIAEVTEDIRQEGQAASADTVTTETGADEFLRMIESINPEALISISDTDIPSASDRDEFKKEISKMNSERKYRKMTKFVTDQAKFLANYVIVSVLVFFVLLGAANYSAYSTIAYNYINPNNLKNSSQEILNVIDNSKIKVFADEDNSLLGKEQQNTMQKKLAEDNTQLRDTYFSPKKLVPLKSNVNLTVDIVPYENRIIIPKIGKNVPLVDVDARRGNLDFVNLENIFMSELEKGVLRYPGTAKPGENGVSFIFGHSSNYPWLKGEYNDVFAMLDNLVMGDEIIIYYNQKKYTYVINEKQVIKPGNLKILERDPSKKELSLMTCWPIGTSLNRLITFAELKSVN